MRTVTTAWWTQAVQNRLIGLVLAMVVFVALIASPASISTPSVAPFCIEGFAILLFATLLLRARWDLRPASIAAFLRFGPNLAVLMFLGFALLSCLFSPFRAISLQDTLKFGAGVLLYFVVAYQFRHSEQITRLTDVLVGVGIAAAVLGCAAFGSGREQAATGLFGDHQLYGSFLMILLPFAAIGAITEKVLNRQLAAQIATVLILIALLLAHSRSAWVGAAVGLTVVGVLAVLFVVRSRKRTGTRGQFLLQALLVAAGLGFFLLLTPLSGSFLERADTFTNLKHLDAWQDRQEIWHGTLRIIKERPLTGLGAGLYPYYHYDYTGKGLPIRSLHQRPSLTDEAHNFYLQTAAEIGLPGLIALASILLTFWVLGVRQVSKLERGVRRNMLIAALGATTAFAADAFASPSWQFGQILMFFWLALGVGVACMRPAARGFLEGPIEGPVEGPITEPHASDRVRRPAAVLASLGLCALLPTGVLGGPTPGYITPDHIIVTPNLVTGATAGNAYPYTATLIMSDGSNGGNVTLDPHTTWSELLGHGTLVPAAPYEDYDSVPADSGRGVIIAADYHPTASESFKSAAKLLFQ